MSREQRRQQRGPRRGAGGLAPRRILPPGWGTPIFAGVLVIGVVAVIAFAVIQATGGGEPTRRGAAEEQDQSVSLPGEWIDPLAEYPDTANHVEGEVPFCKDVEETISGSGRVTCSTSNPPTSGPHSGTAARWGIYEESNAVPKENFVHNMEHAGVVVTYKCSDCADVVDQLQDIVQGYLEDGRLVVMTPYDGMDEDDTVALLAWSRMDKFPVSEFDADRVRRFIETHERRFNPEGF